MPNIVYSIGTRWTKSTDCWLKILGRLYLTNRPGLIRIFTPTMSFAVDTDSIVLQRVVLLMLMSTAQSLYKIRYLLSLTDCWGLRPAWPRMELKFTEMSVSDSSTGCGPHQGVESGTMVLIRVKRWSINTLLSTVPRNSFIKPALQHTFLARIAKSWALSKSWSSRDKSSNVSKNCCWGVLKTMIS